VKSREISEVWNRLCKCTLYFTTAATALGLVTGNAAGWQPLAHFAWAVVGSLLATSTWPRSLVTTLQSGFGSAPAHARRHSSVGLKVGDVSKVFVSKFVARLPVMPVYGVLSLSAVSIFVHLFENLNYFYHSCLSSCVRLWSSKQSF